jgi:outer membrane immunogenic protein
MKSFGLNSKSVSLWLSVGVLAVTVSAFGQQSGQSSAKSDGVLIASANNAPAAPAAAPAPAPAASGSSFSWKGFYIGVNIGRGSNNADTFVNPLPSATQFINLLPQTINPDPSGVTGGGQMGFNWQMGHFVFGPEVDFGPAGIDGKKVVSPIIQNDGTPFFGSTPGGHITVSQRTDSFGSLRGRAGFTLVPRLLVYGTGGLAFGHVGDSASTDFRPVGTTNYVGNIGRTGTGLTYGGGAEGAVTNHVTVKGEYLHYELNTETFTANPQFFFPPFQVAYTWKNTDGNIIRFGVNFKF